MCFLRLPAERPGSRPASSTSMGFYCCSLFLESLPTIRGTTLISRAVKSRRPGPPVDDGFRRGRPGGLGFRFVQVCFGRREPVFLQRGCHGCRLGSTGLSGGGPGVGRGGAVRPGLALGLVWLLGLTGLESDNHNYVSMPVRKDTEIPQGCRNVAGMFNGRSTKSLSTDNKSSMPGFVWFIPSERCRTMPTKRPWVKRQSWFIGLLAGLATRSHPNLAAGKYPPSTNHEVTSLAGLNPGPEEQRLPDTGGIVVRPLPTSHAKVIAAQGLAIVESPPETFLDACRSLEAIRLGDSVPFRRLWMWQTCP
jgi:hypothetical protein